ncbi:MAG TPA: hypothetical protein VD790_09555 [Thermoleophilaceae bacterium]|nr:hypothetical protein [Thermoleophilaceae bacterium]
MGRTATKSALEAYCPHCFLLIESEANADWPPEPTRCPHCRLLIGEGRARPTADASPGARGTAAGVFAHRAKRGDQEDVSEDEVCDAIRTVAEELGARPERLLMVDYQQRASADPSLPDLGDVFAAYGSWKRARREAAAAA